jgi:hypothetical protein
MEAGKTAPGIGFLLQKTCGCIISLAEIGCDHPKAARVYCPAQAGLGINGAIFGKSQ